MQRRIADKLRRPAVQVPEEEPVPAVEAPRFAWVRSAAMAAACIAVCGGTFAGLFWLNAHMPPAPQESGSLAQTEHMASLAHAIGETYAVHLTDRGELLLTVQSAEASAEMGLYEVTLTLQGSDAVVYADNFMIAVGQENGLWSNVSPCAVRDTDAAVPYALRV